MRFREPSPRSAPNGGSVDDWHELRGRDHAADGMVPANEGFRAEQAAIRQTDLRLIEQFEFISLDGERQFGLESQPCFQFLPDRFLEQDMTAASCRLGATESEMAIAQQFVDRVATRWICGRADTDRDAVLTRPGQQRRAECKADAFAELCDGFGHIGAWDRDGK